jgi:hypothetical protein
MDDPCGSRLWLRSLYAHGVVQGAAGMHRDEGSVGAGVGVIQADDHHAVGDGGLLAAASAPDSVAAGGHTATRAAWPVTKEYSQVVPTTHANALSQADLSCDGKGVSSTRRLLQPEVVRCY